MALQGEKRNDYRMISGAGLLITVEKQCTFHSAPGRQQKLGFYIELRMRARDVLRF